VIKALQRLPQAEEQALIEIACANGLDRKDLRCVMTRQQDQGVGRFKKGRGPLSGEEYRISYDLLLCQYCGNLEPSAVCPGKVQQIKAHLNACNP